MGPGIRVDSAKVKRGEIMAGAASLSSNGAESETPESESADEPAEAAAETAEA